MAVRIRMKRLGRKHRPFYRICVQDIRRPRDGRVLEELGTYDPMVPETDARALINGERVQYWLSVGALPSDNVKVLIKKYGANGTHLQQQKAALDRLAQSKRTVRLPRRRLPRRRRRPRRPKRPRRPRRPPPNRPAALRCASTW